MHDFDKARRERHEEREKLLGDRSFVFGGQTFQYRANVHYSVIRDVAEITEDTDGKSVFTRLEDAAIAMVDPADDGIARFRQVCDPKNPDPVTWDDLSDLANWLIERSMERPPTQSVSSAGTPQTSGTGSTETSSTAPAAA